MLAQHDKRWISFEWILGCGLLLAVVVTYAPVLQAGFIWDDDLILTANPCIVGPLGFTDIWTRATSEPAFAPLTRSTLWLEHRLWGLAPWPYHLVNVLWHGASAILLWRLLASLKVRGAWLGAALWALHPVEAESVGWVAEMKNTESGFFFLLALICFVRWVEARMLLRNAALNRDFTLTLLFSALAMLSKASTVVLPVIAGLCAWWLEGKWRWRNLVALAPMALMSAAVSIASIWGQKQQMAAAVGLQLDRSWPVRLVTAGQAVWFYLWKLVWPDPLSAVYPKWKVDAEQATAWLPFICVLVVLVVLWRWRRSWARGLFFAFASFLVALLPVIGLAENTLFHYAWVYDHLQYLASMAVMALAGAAVACAANGSAERRAPIFGFAGGWLLVLAGLTWQRAEVYTSSERLWTDAAAKNPGSWLVHYNLGDALAGEGRTDAALVEFTEALKLQPPFAEAYRRIGEKFAQVGRKDDALTCYRQALARAPKDGVALGDLGQARLQKGDVAGAIAAFSQAVMVEPGNDVLEMDLGVAWYQKGELDEAITAYRRGLALNPGVASSHFNLALALAGKRQFDEAIVEFKRALAIDPGDADSHFHLANVLLSEKRLDEAIAEYRAALGLTPTNAAQVHNNLGITLAQSGRPDEAVVEFIQVVALMPNSVSARRNLAAAKAAASKMKVVPAK